jgi:hypothetical protein
MKIILIALLYATPTSEPVVQVADFVYDNMQKCYQDSEFAHAVLMEGAPYPESFIDMYCVVLPSEA